MEAIGGSLGVISEPGAGSTFWLELPLATTTANFAESELDVTPTTPDNEARLATVLYVEDNIGNVRLLERLLAHRPSIELVTTMQGSSGLRTSARAPP